MNTINLRTSLSTLFMKSVIRVICKIDSSEISNIPHRGPGIIIINHINFLEVPLIQVCMAPRKMHGIVKKETWNIFFLRFFLNTYGAIPVTRGGANIETFKLIKKSLENEAYICLAPEGTRSKNGILQKGKPEITSIAMMSDTTIIPVTHYGGEEIWKNLKKLKRTKVTFKVGKPFKIKQSESNGKENRQKITKEIMFQMAHLLPENMRGVYSDISNKSEDFLVFTKQ